MKKNLITSLNKKYTKELEASLEIIKPKLIEAFIHIYGEKHRQYIIYTMNNIDYIFFISEAFNQVLLTYQNRIRKHDRYIMKKYLAYLKKLDFIYKSISIKEEQKFIIKNYLLKFPYEEELLVCFINALQDDCPCYKRTLIMKETQDSLIDTILLPIFTIDLKTIIHEINHALTVDTIGYTNEELIMKTLFPTEYSEELINDFIAEKVFQEYKKIGGIIPKTLKRISVENGYKENDYIVNYLFLNFESLILESAISKNYNLFYELVGQENINQLALLMDDLYQNGYDEEIYIKVIQLVMIMFDHYQNSKEIDYESSFKKLESLGYQIRKLK